MFVFKILSHRIIPVMVVIVIMVGCAEEEKIQDGVHFSHDDFKKTEEMKGELVNIPLRGKPMEYIVLRDSIVLVNYWEGGDYPVDVINMKTGKLLKGIGKKGSEPGAFISVSLKYKSSFDNCFFIRDVTKNMVVRYDIDSLLDKENYTGQFFDIPSLAGDAAFYSRDSMLLFNSYFLKIGDSLMNANSDSPLFFLNLKTDSLYRDVMNFESSKQPQYFTPNVTGGDVLINPASKNIWLVDNYFDRITIYDKELKPLKYLLGPEKVKIKYELRPDSAIYFKSGKYHRSFYPGVCSDKHVYLLYMGIKGIDLNKTAIERPVTILKMDWEGAPVEEYKLDRYLYNMSVSTNEKLLYGTTAQRFGDTARLVKYNLQHSF